MPFHCSSRALGPRVWDRNIKFRFSNSNHRSFLVAPDLAPKIVLFAQKVVQVQHRPELRLPYTFRGVSRLSDVARLV